MDITIPEVPAGILTLLSFFAPYAIALVNRPTWSASAKRLMSVGVSVLLAAAVWVLYFAITGDGLTDWPKMIILAVVITQASYALVTEESSKAVSRAVHLGDADDEGGGDEDDEERDGW